MHTHTLHTTRFPRFLTAAAASAAALAATAPFASAATDETWSSKTTVDSVRVVEGLLRINAEATVSAALTVKSNMILANGQSGQNASGTLKISNGGVVSVGGFTQLGNNYLTKAALTLGSGGTLETQYIIQSSALSDKKVSLTLNGGTIKATADSTSQHPNFFEGFAAASVGYENLFLSDSGLNGAPALIFDTNSHQVTISQTLGDLGVTAGIEKTGAGTLTLTDTQFYGGETRVSGGTLALSGAGELRGSTNVILTNDGTLDISGVPNVQGGNYDTSVRQLSSTSTNSGVILGNRTLQVWTNVDSEFAGVISGAGGLYVDTTGYQVATLTLSGANTYTGKTTLGDAQVALTVTGTLGGGNYAGTIANAGVLTFNQTADQTLSGKINGAGSLEKSGTGTLTLSGESNYSGGTTVSGGILRVLGELRNGLNHDRNIVLSNNGKIAFNSTGTQNFSGILSGTGIIEMETEQSIVVAGTLRPGGQGETGTLTFTVQKSKTVTLSAGATLAIDLNALATTSDLLVVSGGNLTLGSGDGGVKLQVAVSNGTVADNVEFVIARALNGASILGAFADGATTVTASNQQEFSIYARESDGNSEIVLKRGDPPPPPPPPPPPSGGTVPEPSTYALIGGAGALLLAIWRKRKQRTGRRTGNAGCPMSPTARY
jgi:fibronectin-binding autotransporter adhesin